MDTLTVDLTSTTGVAAFTGLLIQIIKRALGTQPWFKKVPIFVYAIIISGISSFIANKFLHILNGNTGHVVWQAIGAAATSSGFFTWINNPQTPEGVLTNDAVKLAIGSDPKLDEQLSSLSKEMDGNTANTTPIVIPAAVIVTPQPIASSSNSSSSSSIVIEDVKNVNYTTD